MGATAIHHYNLHAERSLLEALREFYCGVLGLETGPRPTFRMDGYWLYAKDEPIVHLTEAAPGETRVTHTATTFDHLAFACVDLAAMEQLLAKKAIPFSRSQVPPNGPVQLFLSDPAGNGVELIFV